MNTRDLLAAATPRPWEATRPEPGQAPTSVVRAGRRQVARTAPTMSVANDEDFANAELIARAANEYEALVHLEDTGRALDDALRFHEDAVFRGRLRQFREAIAALNALRGDAARSST